MRTTRFGKSIACAFGAAATAGLLIGFWIVPRAPVAPVIFQSAASQESMIETAGAPLQAIIYIPEDEYAISIDYSDARRMMKAYRDANPQLYTENDPAYWEIIGTRAVFEIERQAPRIEQAEK